MKREVLFYKCDLCGHEGANREYKCSWCCSPLDYKEIYKYTQQLQLKMINSLNVN